MPFLKGKTKEEQFCRKIFKGCCLPRQEKDHPAVLGKRGGGSGLLFEEKEKKRSLFNKEGPHQL